MSKRMILRAVATAALAFVGWSQSAYGQVFTWTNAANGTFSVAANWSPAGPPNASTEGALFDAVGAYTVTLTADASFGSLNVSAGTVTFAGATRTMTLASDVFITGGTTNLQIGTLNTATELEVRGRINVGSNTFISTGSVSVGRLTANGTLTIDGGTILSTSTTPLQIGGAGLDGTMTISNAGVGTFAGGLDIADSVTNNTTGTLNITGASQVTLSGGNLFVGIRDGLASTGRLILNGNSVLTHNGSGTTSVGGLTESVGTIAIGSGTFITSTGTFTINANGTVTLDGGTMTVRGPLVINGGSLRDPTSSFTGRFDPQSNITVQNAGDLLMRGLTRMQPGTTLRVQSDSSGAFDALSVGDAGTGSVIIDGDLSGIGFVNGSPDDFASNVATFGANGGAATVTISNGGLMAFNTVNMGIATGAGTVTVTGGSQFTTNTLLNVGSLSRVTVTGSGLRFNSVDISGGRIITDANSTLTLSSSGGLVRVRDGGTFSIAGGGLTAGNFDMQVLSGGLIEAPIISLSGDGSIAVDGLNSRLIHLDTATASFWNGSAAGSTFSISNFGRGTFTNVIAGSTAGVTNINIGANGLLTGTSFSLGEIGTAIMTIGGDGAQVAVRSGGVMNVGTLAGAASVTVSDGGQLNAASATLNVSGLGRLVINGGEVITNSVNVSGLGSLLFNRGTLTLNSGSFLVGAGGQFGNTPILGAGQFIRATGGTTVTAGRTLTLDGGTLSTTSINNTGDFALLRGGIVITGASSLTIGSAGMLDQPINLNSSSGITVAGLLRVDQGADFIQSGGSVSAGSISVLGAWNFDGGNVTAGGGVNVGTLGVLNIRPDRTMTFAGVLTNDGVVDLNGGTARLGGSSNLLNNGLLAGEGIVDQFVTNSTGEIRPDAGKSIRFTRVATNAGLINLNNGTIDLPVGLINGASGRVTGRGALWTNGSISNAGTFNLASGITDIRGTLNNNSGKVIVSGLGLVNFFNDVNNGAGSELRVSAGSAAVFFGNVSGVAQITGSGTTIFEGSTSFGRLANSGHSVVTQTGQLNVTEIRQSSLNVEGRVEIDNAIVPSISRLNTLEIAGTPAAWTGRVDLFANAMILDYTGASPLTTIADYIRTGFAGGAWNGNGILSTKAQLNPGTALGFAEATDLGSPSSFLGEPIDNTTLLIRYTLNGDANLDRLVNINDFSLLAANFNIGSSRWSKGDFNFDNVTNIGDFALLAANFNRSLPTELPRGGTIPEPAAVGAISGILVAMRRGCRCVRQCGN